MASSLSVCAVLPHLPLRQDLTNQITMVNETEAGRGGERRGRLEQAAVEEKLFCCNNCFQTLGSGNADRYKCLQCVDFDLCIRCMKLSTLQPTPENAPHAPATHILVRIAGAAAALSSHSSSSLLDGNGITATEDSGSGMIEVDGTEETSNNSPAQPRCW